VFILHHVYLVWLVHDDSYDHRCFHRQVWYFQRFEVTHRTAKVVERYAWRRHVYKTYAGGNEASRRICAKEVLRRYTLQDV
jgi:hypothetical protein